MAHSSTTFVKKALLCGLMVLAFGTSAMAQKEIGVGVVFGTQSDDIGVSMRMRLPLPWWHDLYVVPSVDLLEFGKNQYFVALNCEAQADFAITPAFSVYPAAGMTLGIRDRYTTTQAEDNVQIGFNLGGGARYDLTPRLTGIGELKASVGGFEQLLLTVGVMVDI